MTTRSPSGSDPDRAEARASVRSTVSLEPREAEILRRILREFLGYTVDWDDYLPANPTARSIISQLERSTR